MCPPIVPDLRLTDGEHGGQEQLTARVYISSEAERGPHTNIEFHSPDHYPIGLHQNAISW